MLELRSVDAGYGSFQALFGIDLDVRAGEAVGVIGPNGAGKTTLLRVISGLIRPSAGSISAILEFVLPTSNTAMRGATFISAAPAPAAPPPG